LTIPGLFLRRHFLQFSVLKSGELITNLLKRLQKNRHCRVLKLSKNASVYYLNSRPSTGQPAMRTCGTGAPTRWKHAESIFQILVQSGFKVDPEGLEFSEFFQSL
jgi:hypothetical protein